MSVSEGPAALVDRRGPQRSPQTPQDRPGSADPRPGRPSTGDVGIDARDDPVASDDVVRYVRFGGVLVGDDALHGAPGAYRGRMARPRPRRQPRLFALEEHGHPCAAVGCRETVAPRALFCDRHRAMVPISIRADLAAAERGGLAWVDAADQAIAAVADVEASTRV